jgi:DnaJ-class molecular chaperone
MVKKIHVKAYDRNPPKQKKEQSTVKPCAHCNGTGYDMWGTCNVCKGKGWVRI